MLSYCSVAPLGCEALQILRGALLRNFPLQLGQIGDDSDATCSGPSRRRIGHTSKRESANVAKLGIRDAPNCRNWDLERVITTQRAAESHKGVYQYVEVWLRKLC